MNDITMEMSIELFVEIQKFIGFIEGFVSDNEQIDNEKRDKILEKIKNLNERLRIYD